MESGQKELSCLGLVMRAQEYGDSDYIYTLLTDSSGKLGIIARGVRGGKRFSRGIPEILDLGKFDLFRGRGQLLVLKHFQPQHTFKNMRQNLSSFVCACCWVETLEHLTAEAHQDSHELFEIAVTILKMLDEVKEPRMACRILCEGMDAALQRTGFGSEISGQRAGFKKLQALVKRIEEVSGRGLRSWASVIEVIESLPSPDAM